MSIAAQPFVDDAPPRTGSNDPDRPRATRALGALNFFMAERRCSAHATGPMLILAAALAFFHLGNGAMLPLYGLALVGAGKGNAAWTPVCSTEPAASTCARAR